MAHAHDNDIYFKADDDSITSISFSYNNQYVVTEGQPFNGVSESGNGTTELKVTANAGRKKSDPPAVWYCDQVGNEGTKMIHTEHGDYRPQELNFAFTGTLTINGTSFSICLGQGSYGTTNNWGLNSNNMSADSNNKGGTLTNGSNSYHLSQDGSDGFKVKMGS